MPKDHQFDTSELNHLELLDPIKVIMSDPYYSQVLKLLLLKSYNLQDMNLLNHEYTMMLQTLYLSSTHLQLNKQLGIIINLTNQRKQIDLFSTNRQLDQISHVLGFAQ